MCTYYIYTYVRLLQHCWYKVPVLHILLYHLMSSCVTYCFWYKTNPKIVSKRTARTSTPARIEMYVYIYICRYIYINIYVQMYIHVYIYIHMHICMYVHACICDYINISIYITSQATRSRISKSCYILLQKLLFFCGALLKERPSNIGSLLIDAPPHIAISIYICIIYIYIYILYMYICTYTYLY